MFVNVNWNAFQAKFGEASEEEFELLCTLIFCRMYNRPFGIAAYRNHPGLETMSIEVAGKHIGIQAKFYLGKFSQHTTKIKKAVSQALNQHPELDELLFFLPMDLDYSPKGKGNNRPTQAQRAVEKIATDNGVTIRWFGHSQFKATLADKSYEYWTCHFFHPSRDILKFVESVERRKEQRFDNAENCIDTNGFHVAIDRSATIKTILESQSKATVITGEGGVGKTALLKSVDEALSAPGILCLGLHELADFFDGQKMEAAWSIGLKDFLDLHSDCQKRILIVDEAEKTELLSPPGDSGTIAPILADFHAADWTIVFSTRPSHAEMWANFCNTSLRTPPDVVEIPRLSPEELKKLAEANGFPLPADLLIRDVLRTPFYLKEFLSLSKGERAGNFRDFKRHLWECRIQGNNPNDMSSKVFVDMMERRLRAGNYWVDVHPAESEAAKGLLQRGILVRDTGAERFYLGHDIYEEWALEKIIFRAFEDVGDTPDLWTCLQDKPAMHRAYRSWMTDRLHLDGTSVQNLVESSLTGDPSPWQRETLLAVLASPSAGEFLKLRLPHLLEDNGKLLKEMVSLVRLSCREPAPSIKDTLLADMGFDPKSADFQFQTRPCGNAWDTLIHFLYENRRDVLKVEQDENLHLLHAWCIANQKGPTTRDAARLALDIAITNIGTTWENHLFDRDNEKLLFETLSFGAAEIKEELEKCIGAYLAKPEGRFNNFPANYCESIIGFSLEHLPFIAALPDLTRRMLATLFHPNPREHVSWEEKAERKMGIPRHGAIAYRPLSAYQTPIYFLLRHDFDKTLDFLIAWLNDLASAWAQSDTGTTTTTFTAEDGKQYEQHVSYSLWCANRGCGTPELPRVFVCAHMALEKILLECDEAWQDEKRAKLLEGICLYIFLKARTASLSGILNTLVLKNPNRYFKLASLLASSFEAIQFDMLRAEQGERSCGLLYWSPLSSNLPYCAERAKTLAETFRHTSLQTIMFGYQWHQCPEWEQRCRRMETILDSFEKTGEQDKILFVCKTDRRKVRLGYALDQQGRKVPAAYPQLPPEIVEASRQWLEEHATDNLALGLKLWADAKIKGESVPVSVAGYETDQTKLFADCSTVFSTSATQDSFLLGKARAVIASALLKCFPEMLDNTLRTQCKRIVLDAALSFVRTPPVARIMSVLDMADVFSALTELADDSDPELAEAAWFLSLIGMLQEAQETIGIDQAIFDSIRKKAETSKGYDRKFLAPYLLAKTEFDAFVRIPEVEQALLSGEQSPEELFVEQRADFLEGLGLLEKDRPLPPSNTYPVEAAKNVLAMLPGTAMKESGICNEIFLANIERVLSSIYRLDQYGDLPHGRLALPAQRYRTNFSRLLLHLGAEERAIALAQVAKVPLALSEDLLLSAIVHEANKVNAKTAFWDIWETMRPAMGNILKDPGVYTRQTDVEAAFETYFLGQCLWFGHPEACQLVGKENLRFFKQCLDEWKWPMVAVVAFQSFLELAGLRFWEEGIPMLGTILEQVKVGSSKRLEKRLVALCDPYMRKMATEHGAPLRKRPGLRQAVHSILRFLKAEKSQAGYDLENHFM